LKVFFDEDVPHKLARSLPQHDVHTVVSMQWGGIKNGTLLQFIEREGFKVFPTGDKNMQNQQRLEGRPFAVLIMSAINWPVVRPHIDKIAAAIDEARPGTVKTIDLRRVHSARKTSDRIRIPFASVLTRDRNRRSSPPRPVAAAFSPSRGFSS